MRRYKEEKRKKRLYQRAQDGVRGECDEFGEISEFDEYFLDRKTTL